MELSFKNKFGQKILKVALDGGFDCLTVMALLHGGCFCSAAGSGDFAGNRADQLKFNFNKLKIECMKNGVRVNILLTSKPLLTLMRL